MSLVIVARLPRFSLVRRARARELTFPLNWRVHYTSRACGISYLNDVVLPLKHIFLSRKSNRDVRQIVDVLAVKRVLQ